MTGVCGPYNLGGSATWSVEGEGEGAVGSLVGCGSSGVGAEPTSAAMARSQTEE
jgi:hypothetical protein